MSAGVTVKVERTLSVNFVDSVLITAFDGHYGGCNYWAQAPRTESLGDDGIVEVNEQSNWTLVRRRLVEPTGNAAMDLVSLRRFDVDASVLATGIQRILDGDTPVADSIKGYVLRGVLEDDAGEIDSIAADCIVQAGWFGKIIFG